MSNTYFLIFLLLLKYYESKLVSVFALVNQGPYIPSHIDDEIISKEIYPFQETNLLPNGLSLHIEFGSILRLKYIDNDSSNDQYGNFSKVDNFINRVKIYSANAPAALQSSIGQAFGLFPNFTPHIKKINERGETMHLLEKQTIDMYHK